MAKRAGRDFPRTGTKAPAGSASFWQRADGVGRGGPSTPGLPTERIPLQTQRDWLPVEGLPGYAPDLNPTEQVWNNIKSTELANFCPDQLTEANKALRRGLQRLSHTRSLPYSFLQHAGLSF